MGGGALMTPVLVLGFGIEPLAAVSSDLVAAVVMKPIGGGIHFRRGTVHTGLVKWLALGSVPGALFGSYVISHISGDVGNTIKIVLGVVLLIAAAAMVVRSYLSRHRRADGLVDAGGDQVVGHRGRRVDPEEDQGRRHQGAAAHAGQADDDSDAERHDQHRERVAGQQVVHRRSPSPGS
jgi:membrane protein implicated in regulation of membrane protease activity